MSFALSWIVVVGFLAAPSSGREWLKDYGQALEATKQSQRPLLIVIDQQPKWLAHIEPVSDATQPVAPGLLKKFTLCHVDATTPYGKRVAKAFRTTTFPLTVIIDKTGSVQLVKQAGRLSTGALTSLLITHQQGELPAATAQPVACRT